MYTQDQAAQLAYRNARDTRDPRDHREYFILPVLGIAPYDNLTVVGEYYKTKEEAQERAKEMIADRHFLSCGWPATWFATQTITIDENGGESIVKMDGWERG